MYCPFGCEVNYKTPINDENGRISFNKKIGDLRSFIESEMMNSHKSEIAQEWLIKVIDKHWFPEKYQINLFSYITSFIKASEERPNPKNGRPVCYKMRREYEVTYGYLKRYAECLGKKLDFKDIDLKFYDGFTSFLQKEGLAVNTIGKKIQTLKIFLNAAKNEGINNYDTFKSKKFVSVNEEADTIYLNENELEKISVKDFSSNLHLDHARDLFLLGCWTGCRFSDLSQITLENILGDLLHIKQQKTGTKVLIPLHPIVKNILNKYNGLLPRVISNQKFNLSLKKIAEQSEINDYVHKAITRGGIRRNTKFKKWELVTTHTARRSFATNLYKQDFPTLSIMAITGHKTEEAFLKYIKVTPDEHARKLQLHWNKKYLKAV